MTQKILPHTLLITGSTEEERQAKAYQVAQEAIPTEDPTQCPDFIEIKQADKASIGIEVARGLREWVSTKPRAKKKVVYIHNAELLTVEAQNSLLKLLEEPPEGTILILSVNQKRDLLPTVISRCMEIVLEDNRDYSEIKASSSEVVALLQGTLSDRFEWCATHTKLFKDEMTLRRMLEEWLLIVRDVMMARSEYPEGLLRLPSVDDTKRVATLLTTAQCLETLELFTEALEKMETSKVDRQLLFEVTLLSLPS